MLYYWIKLYVCTNANLSLNTGDYYYKRLRSETVCILSFSLINTLIYLRGEQFLHCKTEMLPRSSVPCSAMLVLTVSHKIYHYIYWSGLQHRMKEVQSLWLPTSWIKIEFPYRWGRMQKHLDTHILFWHGVDYIWWIPLLTVSLKGIMTNLSSVTRVLRYILAQYWCEVLSFIHLNIKLVTLTC